MLLHVTQAVTVMGAGDAGGENLKYICSCFYVRVCVHTHVSLHVTSYNGHGRHFAFLSLRAAARVQQHDVIYPYLQQLCMCVCTRHRVLSTVIDQPVLEL
jgi:hypothetical protein